MVESSEAGTILNIEKLNVSYPIYEADPVHALRGLDLKISKGEIR